MPHLLPCCYLCCRCCRVVCCSLVVKTSCYQCRLSQMSGREDWSALAEKTVHSFAATLARSPVAIPQMCVAVDFLLAHPKQFIFAAASTNPETQQVSFSKCSWQLLLLLLLLLSLYFLCALPLLTSSLFPLLRSTLSLGPSLFSHPKDLQAMYRELQQHFLPNKVVMATDGNGPAHQYLSEKLPFLKVPATAIH